MGCLYAVAKHFPALRRKPNVAYGPARGRAVGSEKRLPGREPKEQANESTKKHWPTRRSLPRTLKLSNLEIVKKK